MAELQKLSMMPVSTTIYVVVRDVKKSEYPWLHRDFLVGDKVQRYNSPTYNCLGDKQNNMAVCELGGTSFFEFPISALSEQRSYAEMAAVAPQQAQQLENDSNKTEVVLTTPPKLVRRGIKRRHSQMIVGDDDYVTHPWVESDSYESDDG